MDSGFKTYLFSIPKSCALYHQKGSIHKIRQYNKPDNNSKHLDNPMIANPFRMISILPLKKNHKNCTPTSPCIWFLYKFQNYILSFILLFNCCPIWILLAFFINIFIRLSQPSNSRDIRQCCYDHGDAPFFNSNSTTQ
jgi:hypothetical protein